MSKGRLIVGILLTVLVPVLVEATCGPTQVCIDVNSSFTGQVITDGIRLSWSSSHEDSNVAIYKLRRYNCSDPATCSVLVTTVGATGTCNTLQSYTYTDSPATPYSQWTYTLEVWKNDGSRACAVDTQPQ